MLHPSFDPKAKEEATARGDLIAKGLNASPARPPAWPSSTPSAPMKRAEAGEAVILVRPETSPEDVHGMLRLQGHPHPARRRHLARGRGGARQQPALRGRLRRHHASTRSKRQFTVGRPRDQGRRRHLHRRHHRRGLRRRHPDDRRRFRQGAGAGDAPRAGPTRSAAWASGPTPTIRAMRSARARLRRRGHRPVPHRAHVL